MKTTRTLIIIVFAVMAVVGPARPNMAQTPHASSDPVSNNWKGQGRPFPQSWERMFGAGRAILTLRESYRNDLRDVKKETGFQFVRFHAIFHDEAGLYSE